MRNNLPIIPIWYVIARREVHPVLSGYGIRHILFVVPCYLNEIDEIFKRYVPQLATLGISIETSIYLREPVNLGHFWEEQMLLHEKAMKLLGEKE